MFGRNVTVVVTGAAGFIGSHLAQRLLRQGATVLGIDCLTSYYDPARKRRNLETLASYPLFTFLQRDLCELTAEDLPCGPLLISHQAGQPGVRTSWGTEFAEYLARNVEATQQLLEVIRRCNVERLVFASSSSVYGNSETLPTHENLVPRPISPYGVTKLAAEHLCFAYGYAYSIPVTALRYFTVYGPGQRPDMGFSRFIKSYLEHEPIMLYGDGQQTRDFTYVDDIVHANLLALTTNVSGLFNIGGGSRVSVADVLDVLDQIFGYQVKRTHQEQQAGDVRHTAADITAAQQHLGYGPRVSIAEGLERQVAWTRQFSFL